MEDHIQTIQWLLTADFRERPKLDALERMRSLVEAFHATEASEQLRIQPDLAKLSRKLLSVSAFMAEAAMNTKDVSWIRSAILVHAMEGFRLDYRENIRYLVLIAHAAKLLGVSLQEICAPILASTASIPAKTALTQFLERDERMNELSVFGVTTAIRDGSVLFVPVR